MKDENNKIIPLVMLEWVDSAQPISKWRFLSDIEEHDIIRCTSVGWLIHDGKDVKSLAPNLGDCDNSDSFQACGVVSIPTCSITRVVKLKEPK